MIRLERGSIRRPPICPRRPSIGIRGKELCLSGRSILTSLLAGVAGRNMAPALPAICWSTSSAACNIFSVSTRCPSKSWPWEEFCAGKMAATCLTCTATLFKYGQVPVYMRLNLGSETPEIYRFMGSKGMLEVTERAVTFVPQSGIDEAPSYYANSFPRAMHQQYLQDLA